MKRKTIGQLMELQSRYQGRVITYARKLDDVTKRLKRALKHDESTRKATDTVDKIKTHEEPLARVHELDPLSVACTTCDVGSGADCLGKNGETKAPHASRIRAAFESKNKKE